MDGKTLYKKLVDFYLPHMMTVADRQAHVQYAIYGDPLVHEIDFEGSSLEFTTRLVGRLLKESQSRDSGDGPILYLLDATKNWVGIDKQAEIEQLKTEVISALAVNEFRFDDTKENNLLVYTNSILGTPSKDPQFQCDIFMVMPFRANLDPIYIDHIKPICKELDLTIKRGDDPFSQHDIMTEIWSFIYSSKIVIAECTGKNPNVFYEMGLAHAIDKPVILITQNIEDIPFDIRHRRFIIYEYTPRGMRQFEYDMKKAILGITGKG